MSRRSNPFSRISPTALGLVVASLLLSLVPLVATAPSANAAVCQNYGSGWEGDYDGANHFGVRVTSPGLDVTNYSTNCVMVRSLYIWLSQNNFVEVGWFEDDGGVLAKCDDVTSPHVLVYAVVDGFVNCKTGTAAVSSGFHGFRVENPGHDFDFDYWLDGTQVGVYVTNMTQGEVFAASERHKAGDHLGAEFDGLKWLGSAGDWNDWDQLTGQKDTQPWDNVSDYSFCKVNNRHFLIKPSC